MPDCSGGANCRCINYDVHSSKESGSIDKPTITGKKKVLPTPQMNESDCRGLAPRRPLRFRLTKRRKLIVRRFERSRTPLDGPFNIRVEIVSDIRIIGLGCFSDRKEIVRTWNWMTMMQFFEIISASWSLSYKMKACWIISRNLRKLCRKIEKTTLIPAKKYIVKLSMELSGNSYLFSLLLEDWRDMRWCNDVMIRKCWDKFQYLVKQKQRNGNNFNLKEYEYTHSKNVTLPKTYFENAEEISLDK